MNCGGGNAAGITGGGWFWAWKLFVGVGAARGGGDSVFSSGIFCPTVDGFAGTGLVGQGKRRARTSMGQDGSHLHRARMAPHSVSRRDSARVRASGFEMNGKGVGVLSMIGPNPPLIIWVGVEEDDMLK